MRVKSTNIFIAGKLSEIRVTPAQCGWAHIYGYSFVIALFESILPSFPAAKIWW